MVIPIVHQQQHGIHHEPINTHSYQSNIGMFTFESDPNRKFLIAQIVHLMRKEFYAQLEWIVEAVDTERLLRRSSQASRAAFSDKMMIVVPEETIQSSKSNLFTGQKCF
jgi:hypothetical protein